MQNNVCFVLTIRSVVMSLWVGKWVILLNLVHTGNLQFLAIFHNLAGKTSINTPE